MTGNDKKVSQHGISEQRQKKVYESQTDGKLVNSRVGAIGFPNYCIDQRAVL